MNFTGIVNEKVSKLDTTNIETNIFHDFNINLEQSGPCVSQTPNLCLCNSVLNDVNFKFCTIFRLKQLFVSPTRIPCRGSCVTDNIPARISQKSNPRGILNVRLSDH